MVNKTEIVLSDSDEAAHFQTGLSGWVSRQGHYWGNDERAARYDGCTHTRCEDCSEPVDRGRLICPKCSEVRDVKKYVAMPKEEWNGNGMLFSGVADKYFSSWSEIEDYCSEAEEEIKIDELRLVICEPNYLSLLDTDYGCDELAEDGELPDVVLKAIEDFNNIIKAVGAVSWTPGRKAVAL